MEVRILWYLFQNRKKQKMFCICCSNERLNFFVKIQLYFSHWNCKIVSALTFIWKCKRKECVKWNDWSCCWSLDCWPLPLFAADAARNLLRLRPSRLILTSPRTKFPLRRLKLRSRNPACLLALCAAENIDSMRAYVKSVYNSVPGIVSINSHSILEVVKGSL